MWKEATVLSGSLVALLLGGCGSGSELNRQPIEGKVTFNGQPLEHGTVEFQPEDPRTGIQSGTQIKQGQFTIPEEQGLPPGSYRVMPFSSDAPQDATDTDAPPGESMGRPLPKERIPPDYNRNSTLTVDVTEGGDNEFEFTIQ